VAVRAAARTFRSRFPRRCSRASCLGTRRGHPSTQRTAARKSAWPYRIPRQFVAFALPRRKNPALRVMQRQLRCPEPALWAPNYHERKAAICGARLVLLPLAMIPTTGVEAANDALRDWTQAMAPHTRPDPPRPLV
jgi:hypothetical protein